MVFVAFLFGYFAISSSGFSLPEMPPGAVKEMKTKYRVIEHAAGDPKKQISIYDTNKIMKINDQDLEIYPPVYYQTYGLGQWFIGTENKMFQNVFSPELVIIIENSDPLKIYKMKEYPYKYGVMSKKKYLSGKTQIIEYKSPPKILSSDAQKTIISQLQYKKVWTLKNFKFKNGLLICGYNAELPSAIAIWWWKEGYLYNINAVAKANTNFDGSFDISASEGFDFCRRYKQKVFHDR